MLHVQSQHMGVKNKLYLCIDNKAKIKQPCCNTKAVTVQMLNIAYMIQVLEGKTLHLIALNRELAL